MPWALLLALALAGAAELGVRSLGLDRTGPYAWGMGEYDESALRLRSEGPPEVLVLGTSRAREALDLPRLAALLEAEIGRHPTVGSHALSGARAGEAEAILSLALREGRPRLVLLGLDPRFFQGSQEHRDRQARFAALASTIDEAGPTRRATMHAHLGTWLRTFACRSRLAAALRGADELDARSHPLTGGLTLFQQDAPERSLRTHPVDDAWITWHLARVKESEAYTLTEHRMQTARRILRMLAEADVPVLLFEVPLARVWERHLPMLAMPGFRAGCVRLAEEFGVPFVARADLDALFSEEDFHEPSHLGLRGARTLTEALAHDHVLPRFGAALKDAGSAD